MTDNAGETGRESPVERRDVLKAGASAALLAGVTSQSATAQSATGPTVYVGSQDNNMYAVDAATGNKEWEFQMGGGVGSSPTVVDGTVFAGNNNVYALDASTGNIQWANQTATNSPTVVNGTVFMTAGIDSNTVGVVALNATTGAQKWQFILGDNTGAAVTVVDGTVFAGSYDTNVYALDAATGDQQWQFETGGGVGSSPTVWRDTVYVGSEDNNVYALDATTGDKQWQYQTGDVIWSSPTVWDGTVFIGSRDNNVYALDAVTGNKEWEFQTGDEVVASPTVWDGTVFVGSVDNNVYALDASSGTKQWEFQTGSGTWSSPTVWRDTVFVGSSDNNVYALDAATGNKEWQYQTGGTIGYSSPTVVDDPANGDSVGSRVNLGTLGHHHVWANKQSQNDYPPTADAGSNQTVQEGTTVTLDGSNSSDRDGDSLTYSWTQTSGFDVSLTDADTATPEFTAPDVDNDTNLSFVLTVDDGETTDSDTTTVTVTDTNTQPTADAGSNQTVQEGTTVTLDGSNSSDRDGDSLTYSWTQTSGPDVSLTDTDTATPEFTAPDVDAETDLTFELTVDDSEDTDIDTTAVTVTPSADGLGEVLTLDHPDVVAPDGEVTLTVETANSAGTIVKVAPDDFAVELTSDDAVEIADGRAEFIDPSAGDSTYTIGVDIIGGETEDTADIVAWVNAEERSEADDALQSTLTLGGEHPSGVAWVVWDTVTDQNSPTDELTFDDIIDAIQEYQEDEEIGGVELGFQDLVDLIQWYQNTGDSVATSEVTPTDGDATVTLSEVPSTVDPDQSFSITVETVSSAGTIVEFSPDGVDVELASEDAVKIEENRVEFLDPTSGDSMYPIDVDVLGGKDGDTIEVVAWINAEEREEAADTETEAVSVTEESENGPPVVSGSEPPQDHDEDGNYEDVDGDGEFTIGDVQVFFQNRESAVIQNNPEFFNFDGSDPAEVTIADVQALFLDFVEQDAAAADQFGDLDLDTLDADDIASLLRDS